jgi:hypothetical protein
VAPTAAKGGAALLLKWTGIAAIGGAAAIGSAPYIARATVCLASRCGMCAVAATGRLAPSASASRAALAAPAVSATRDATMPEGVPPHVHPISQRAALAGSAPAARLSTQLAALNAVRAALTAGDPAGALALLDQFEHRNPSSPLDEEVAVLRIDALVDAGRRAEATERAAAFLSAYPASAYSQRVRSNVTSP